MNASVRPGDDAVQPGAPLPPEPAVRTPPLDLSDPADTPTVSFSSDPSLPPAPRLPVTDRVGDPTPTGDPSARRAADRVAARAAGRDLERRWVGRYELLCRIGHGGMASVFLARAIGEAGFERRVAIKVIHPHLADDPTLVEMFLDEARLAAQVHHPNVVATLDLGEVEGVQFIVLEFVEGDTLAALVRELGGQRLPLRIALQIAIDACAGLSAAHAAIDTKGRPQGIVHRDISPQNLLVGADGFVKIADFGIARAAGRSQHTRPGQLRGKLAYMAPEQARGNALDQRTDIFALGVVLWELVTGERYLSSPSDAELLERLTTGRVPSWEDLPDHVTATLSVEAAWSLRAVFERALACDPADRYRTAEDLLRDLEHVQLLARAPSPAHPDVSPRDDIEAARRLDPRAELASVVRERLGARIDYLRRMFEGADGASGGADARKPPTDRWLALAAGHELALDTPGRSQPSLRARTEALDARARSGESGASMSAAHSAASSQQPSAPGHARRGVRLPAALLIATVAAIVLGLAWQPGLGSRDTGLVEPADSDEVQWFFSTDPAGAEIWLDGKRLEPLTPASVAMPRGDRPVRIELRLAGHRPVKLSAPPLTDQAFAYPLEVRASPAIALPRTTSEGVHTASLQLGADSGGTAVADPSPSAHSTSAGNAGTDGAKAGASPARTDGKARGTGGKSGKGEGLARDPNAAATGPSGGTDAGDAGSTPTFKPMPNFDE